MWKNQQKRNILEHFLIYKIYSFRFFFSEATYIIPCFMSGVSNTLEAFVL